MSLQALRLDQLEGKIGEEIGVSPWLAVEQDRIDLFARAIDDPQWIHIDPVRAKAGPFGTTIAHGFLTLSLLSHLIETTFSFDDRKMGVNYGLNRVRFTAPLPSGSKIRARFSLGAFEKIAGGVQVTFSTVVEREGGRHYF
jgi:acyl dehydratase